ncbi:MAG: hypothetical protein WBF09_10470 [Candidatus Acidiferrum sp.]
MFHFEIVRASFAGCFRNRRLWLIQFFANPILFALFSAWLLIPVASNLHLVWNLLFAIFLIVAALMFHAGTLNSFFDRESRDLAPLWPAFRRASRHLLAVAVCVAVFYYLWTLVDKLETYSDSLPAYVRSTFPVYLRRLITLTELDKVFSAVLFITRWILASGLLLPLALQTADRGFRGFGLRGLSAWRKTVLNFSYWLLVSASALFGVLATQALMAWTPDFRTSTFHCEAISLSWRLIVSYLFGLFSWMLACSVVSRSAVAARISSNIVGDSVA